MVKQDISLIYKDNADSSLEAIRALKGAVFTHLTTNESAELKTA